ncbi:MAG: hypothetical protein QOC71_53 [Thermoplasmata archaeon]|nr:hypothetical protein [Thermoplasmata archaeon]
MGVAGGRMGVPTKSGKRLVIAGAKRLADIAYEFFTTDSEYEVVAFTVDAAYLDATELYGRPVVPFDQVAHLYPPATHEMFVAIATTGMNRLRERLSQQAKQLGYRLATFVSSRAHVASTAKVGPNSIIFPMVHVNTMAEIGEGVLLGTGTIIEHHARIGDYSFLSVNAMVLGEATIGERCFLGAGCIVIDDVKVGADCLLGAGTCIRFDVAPGKVFAAPKPVEKPFTSLEYYERLAAGDP